MKDDYSPEIGNDEFGVMKLVVFKLFDIRLWLFISMILLVCLAGWLKMHYLTYSIVGIGFVLGISDRIVMIFMDNDYQKYCASKRPS